MKTLLLLALACSSRDDAPVETPAAAEADATEVPPAVATPRFEPLSCELRTEVTSPEEMARVGAGCSDSGQLDEARKLAELSLAAQDSPEAHYVMARALLSMRQLDRSPCEREAYFDDVLQHTLAAAQDPALRAAIARSELFAEARPALRYRVATGVDLSRAGAMELAGLRLYSLGNGAFGSTRQLLLGPGGRASLRELQIDDEPHWTSTETTWSVQDGVLSIEGVGAYPLSADGSLTDGDGELPDWRDVPSECEA